MNPKEVDVGSGKFSMIFLAIVEVLMKKDSRGNAGIQELIRIYREAFRIPENLDYYSVEDYKNAGRNFIKYAFHKGHVQIVDSDQLARE